MDKNTFIIKLHEIGAIKFGTFTLKSGIESPIYLDLRRIISYPALLQTAADLLWQEIQQCDFDLICGVPYTALPFASVLSVQHKLPMIMRRKEQKEYGTKRIVEGVYAPKQTCIIIEDLFTSGSSALETVELLQTHDLIIQNIAILVDREQGGIPNVTKRGYTVHAVYTLSEITRILCDAHLINKESVHAINTFTKQNHISL